MLSVNIICAVHVLLELDDVRDRPRKQDRGLFPHEFGIDDSFRRSILRQVLRTLQRAGYVYVSTNKKYTLLVDARQVTLLDLVRLLHGGVCLGEAFDHYLSIGPEYLPTAEYRKLLKSEARLTKHFVRRLQAVRLQDFRTNVQLRRIVKTKAEAHEAGNK